LASRRARQLHLEDRINYQLVEPGVFPFADNSFDIVFSKDALLHVRNKEALYAEALRVLCPGGQLLVSDWLRADGESFTPVLDGLGAASRQNFHFASLRELGELLERLGFTEIELEDRRAWYQSEARAELKKIQGPLKLKLLQLVGDEVTQGLINFWVLMIAALDLGAFRPGHVRARKPTDLL
jgi:ubiquinone/menaquinone biosynthesis C-methylase UbiE